MIEEPNSKNVSLSDRFTALYKQVVCNGLRKDVLTEDLSGIIELAKMLALTTEETLVFAIVYQFQSTGNSINSNGIKVLLGPYFYSFSDMEEILFMFEKLRAMHTCTEGKKTTYHIRNPYYRAVSKNQVEKLKKIKPHGLEPMLEYFRKKLMDHDFLGISQVEEELEFLKNVNQELSLSKRGFCNPDTLDAYLLGAICTRLYIENRPFETSYFR